MRRMLKHEGDDDCVILPNPRGPSTTWCKLTTPRVDNNDCGAETLRRRAKTMESIRKRLSAVSDNSDKENQHSVQRLRVAEVKRHRNRTCWSTIGDWAGFHYTDEAALTAAVRYVNSVSVFGRNQTLSAVLARVRLKKYKFYTFFNWFRSAFRARP